MYSTTEDWFGTLRRKLKYILTGDLQWKYPRRKKVMLKTGMKVMLHVPDNPRLHKQDGLIKEVTDYGAVVKTSAAASGEFRAMLTEMVLPESNHRSAITKGYTGDTCDKCYGSRMTRAGSCLRCEDCGESSGCS